MSNCFNAQVLKCNEFLPFVQVFCPIESCKELLTLNSIGGLSEFSRHLKRHKSSAVEGIRTTATAILDRWSDVEVGGTSETDVPVGLYLPKSHDRMICLRTLECRKEDRDYNVLTVHGQRKLNFHVKKPRNS